MVDLLLTWMTNTLVWIALVVNAFLFVVVAVSALSVVRWVLALGKVVVLTLAAWLLLYMNGSIEVIYFDDGWTQDEWRGGVLCVTITLIQWELIFNRAFNATVVELLVNVFIVVIILDGTYDWWSQVRSHSSNLLFTAIIRLRRLLILANTTPLIMMTVFVGIFVWGITDRLPAAECWSGLWGRPLLVAATGWRPWPACQLATSFADITT